MPACHIYLKTGSQGHGYFDISLCDTASPPYSVSHQALSILPSLPTPLHLCILFTLLTLRPGDRWKHWFPGCLWADLFFFLPLKKFFFSLHTICYLQTKIIKIMTSKKKGGNYPWSTMQRQPLSKQHFNIWHACPFLFFGFRFYFIKVIHELKSQIF